MFMRVLQSYETTFALIGVQLRTAVEALGRGDGLVATRMLGAAEEALRESSPLWSLCGTMQTEAFLKFREYTDGASAIQSRNYKLIESLCRRPDADRLAGAAFEQVPEVRERIEAGLPNLDDALATAQAAGQLSPCHHARVRAAMEGFEAAVLKWRQTHYRMAVRMLGDLRGTGGSEGQAYLDRGRTIPVFASACPAGHGGREHRESSHGAPAACPMHGRRSFGSGRREAPTHH
jgi:tryptophan 2,3-dioxygenase